MRALWRGSGARAAIAVVIVLATACAGDDASPPSSRRPAVTTTTAAARPDDGTLTVGLLLPTTGDGATIGQFMTDGARRAIDEINAVGGVGGRPVAIVTADEGATPAEAADAIEQLIDADVDAVVGPASSTIALSTLDLLVAADILTCSPSATTLALDAFPDDDLFFRTAPSDSLQALGLAQLAELTGETAVAVAWLDDVYGRPFASTTIAEIESRNVPFRLVADIPFRAADDDFTDEAERVAEQEPGVVIVVADASSGSRFLGALGAAYAQVPSDDVPDIIISDAMRRRPSPQPILDLPPAVRDKIRGLAPAAGGAEDLNGPFATNAYDCANLIALASVVAGSDNPRAMARELPGLTANGEQCETFADCASSLNEGRLVNYDGPAGPVQLDASGEPSSSRFDQFDFGEDGVDRSVRQLVVNA